MVLNEPSQILIDEQIECLTTAIDMFYWIHDLTDAQMIQLTGPSHDEFGDTLAGLRAIRRTLKWCRDNKTIIQEVVAKSKLKEGST